MWGADVRGDIRRHVGEDVREWEMGGDVGRRRGDRKCEGRSMRESRGDVRGDVKGHVSADVREM